MSLRTAVLVTTVGYQACTVIINAFSPPSFSGTRLKDGAFVNTGANPVVISTGSSLFPAVGDDNLSRTLQSGDSLPFKDVDLNKTFVKSTGGASTVEVYGDAV